MESIFVSYAREDESKAIAVYQLLRDNGFTPWIDFHDLVGGKRWQDEIDNAIRSSKAFIACLSTKSVSKRGYAQSELNKALKVLDTIPEGQIYLIPIRLDDCVVPEKLKHLHWIDYFKTDGSEKLLNALCEVLEINREVKETISSSKPELKSQPVPNLQNSLTIIIPVYNESHILRNSIKGLKAEGLLDKYRIIFCDDGSTDNSFEVMQEYSKNIASITCIKQRFNTRKVGAIDEMLKLVKTPFVLTLDADCILSELRQGTLEKLMNKMNNESYSASYFRIIPTAKNWLEKLQSLDYAIFTDALRKILRIPICLIGQGVLWKTEKLLLVLSQHSGKFDGDDLENTIIALNRKMKFYWESETIILKTIPKSTILSLVKQRALSWDFGLLRVLFGKRALSASRCCNKYK